MPEKMPSVGEFHETQREAEGEVATREEALALVEETRAELCAAMETVNATTISSLANSPFGPLPLDFWLSQGPEHAAIHIGQLGYLQTIWGDLDNHRRSVQDRRSVWDTTFSV